MKTFIWRKICFIALFHTALWCTYGSTLLVWDHKKSKNVVKTLTYFDIRRYYILPENLPLETLLVDDSLKKKKDPKGRGRGGAAGVRGRGGMFQFLCIYSFFAVPHVVTFTLRSAWKRPWTRRTSWKGPWKRRTSIKYVFYTTKTKKFLIQTFNKNKKKNKN